MNDMTWWERNRFVLLVMILMLLVTIIWTLPKWWLGFISTAIAALIMFEIDAWVYRK